MKVKLKKHKKSPAPVATKQEKVKSTIEALRNARAYGVPIYVVYDRGYRQIIDLVDRIQKNQRKKSALVAAKQAETIFEAPRSEFLTNDIDTRGNFYEN